MADTGQTALPTRRRGPWSVLLGTAVVLVALLAGTAGALPGRNTVDRNDVQRSAITSKQIKNGQVKPADLARPAPWRVVGRAGQPRFFDRGEGDCVWKSDPSSTYAPTSFRKDPFGRVLLRGAAFASDGPGGDGACDSTQADEAEDGVVFVLPRGYRPQYVSLSAAVYQIAAIPERGAVFATGTVPGGAVLTAGEIAAFDDAEFDAAPAGSPRSAQAPADLSELIPLGGNR